MKLDGMKKRLVIMLGVIGGIILLFIIFIAISSCSRKGTIKLDKVPTTMKEAAIEYYSDLDEKLESGESTMVSIEKLVDEKYMSSLDKLVGKNVICRGYVTIRNNDNRYLYTPYLNCGEDYKSETLAAHIIASEKQVTTGSGLYSMYNRLIYRGEYVNNYLEFAGQSWTILSINQDYSLKLIRNENKSFSSVWDDRYNTDKSSNLGINNYSVSRIKEMIDTITSDKSLLDEEQKAYAMVQNVCIGSRSEEETNNSGDVECSKTVKQLFGLIQVNEFLTASIDSTCTSIEDEQCQNYNYIFNRFASRKFWTLNVDSNSTYKAYAINGEAELYRTSTSGALYLTIQLSPEVLYLKGDGTLDNPYKIVEK